MPEYPNGDQGQDTQNPSDGGGSNPAGSQEAQFREALVALYQKYYGRAPAEWEVQSHLPALVAGRAQLSQVNDLLDADAKRLQIGPYAPAPVVADTPDTPSGGGGGAGNTSASDLGSLSALSSASAAVDPSYLTPWTKQFAAPAAASVGDFVAPTGQSILNDPSYLWRIDQGRGQIENSAAAKGLLNSGGTLSDILNYGQKAASQEYGNVWARDFGLWGAKKQYAQDAYNNAWKDYVEQKDTWYRNQSEPWSKLYQAASLGASAAGA